MSMDKSTAMLILKDYFTEDGDLSWIPGKHQEYLYYRQGNKFATLDGEFTADQLEALAVLMRQESNAQAEPPSPIEEA